MNKKRDDFVTLDTYYNGELYSYKCSQECKNHYEIYSKCFHILDNKYYNVTFSERCKSYNLVECKDFLSNLYQPDNTCKNGHGPEDYDLYDEISMNKIYYIALCSKDKNGNFCDYSNDIQQGKYYPTNLFHLQDGTNTTLEKSCSQGICRENLHYMYKLLVPLYEDDVKKNNTLNYEQVFINNDKKAISYLSSEECTSQDYYEIEDGNLNNQSGALKTSSFSLITIVLISILSIIFY
ncbi:hypothetical protein BCR36DRAFT_583835 [Piromyces finnis]|uniref:Uncharacterized protein n=1 Tax=Piromyces finnis TaxID=1754191 RepID=A0A1Y1V7S3_9FUNG|nr:hypothetical protein BCR36DRAFT_583835 [Piromyces finnis]|eukprot:ORX49228.1 hypothetical protein BCR36DRAFT_583835 [Piromyces finnis]